MLDKRTTKLTIPLDFLFESSKNFFQERKVGIKNSPFEESIETFQSKVISEINTQWEDNMEMQFPLFDYLQKPLHRSFYKPKPVLNLDGDLNEFSLRSQNEPADVDFELRESLDQLNKNISNLEGFTIKSNSLVDVCIDFVRQNHNQKKDDSATPKVPDQSDNLSDREGKANIIYSFIFQQLF